MNQHRANTERQTIHTYNQINQTTNVHVFGLYL